MRKIGVSMCSCTPEFTYVIDSCKMTYKSLVFAADMDFRAAVECAGRGDRRGCEYYSRRAEIRYRDVIQLWDDNYRTSHYREYLDWKQEVMEGRAQLE